MNKNYIEEIAEILGVKLNEEFNLVGKDNHIHSCSPFHFDKEALRDSHGGACQATLIGSIIYGVFSVSKLPWKPSLKEEFYFIDTNLHGEDIVVAETWFDTISDRARYLCGNCFKTADEAKKNTDNFKDYLATKTVDVSWREN